MTNDKVYPINWRKTQCVLLSLMLCLLVLHVFSSSARAEGVPVVIDLNNNETTADFPGVYFENNTLTLTLPGEYLLRGTLSNGQIIVDCEQDGKVKLNLGGVSVHCENGPALHIKKCAPRLTIGLVEGTVNELSDGADYAEKQSNVDAVIFSKSDLTITGTGTLNVTGAYRDGIVSKDDLRFKGGKINVKAVHNGICGKDSVEIYDGEITVHAGNDGIKATNDDAEWGYIVIQGGNVSITCGDDPLLCVHSLSISGCTVNAVVDASLKTSTD